MKTAILVDSTMPLLEYLDYSNIFSVDLTINLEGKEYKASDITFKEINESINKNNEFPKTSLPSINDIEDVFEKIYQDKYDRVFVITLSKGLSGTYQAINMVAQDYIDNNKLEINCLDTKVMNVGNALALDYLIPLINNDLATSLILDQFNEMIDNMSMYVILGDLNHIYKGGRMSRAQFATGELFKIRPLLKLNDDGGISVANKVRGNKKLINTVINYLIKDLPTKGNMKVFITETDSDENFKVIKKELSLLNNIEIVHLTNPIDAITGTHVGPNTIGIAWSKKSIN